MLAIILVASASASDLNETTEEYLCNLNNKDEISVNNVEDFGLEFLDSEKLNQNNDEIISTNYTAPKTSNEIQNCVNSAKEGDTIIFDGYYSFTSTVNVGKRLNFVGINNATVEGSNVRLFSVSNSNVIFKNIIFQNTKCTNGAGGAIYGKCTALNCMFINISSSTSGASTIGGATTNIVAINCTFIGNSATYGGGAMGRGSAVNCTFIGNSAGAIYEASAVNCIFRNNNGYNMRGVSVVNCSFIGNKGCMRGSAVNCTFVNNYDSVTGALSGSAVNCTFINNTARGYGGAMSGSAVNCTFIGNSAGNYGGAMYDSSAVNCTFIGNSAGNYGGAMNGGSAVNCTFINNTAKSGDGGAMNGGSAVNCTFIGNSAGSNGGAMSGGRAENCIFISNHAINNGGVIYFDGKGVVLNCNFINNSASAGGAIYFKLIDGSIIEKCNFTNNTANQGNSIYKYDGINYTVVDCIFDVIPDNINYYYSSIIQVNNLSIMSGQEGIININLSNMFGALSNKIISIFVGDSKYNNTTDSNGFTSFKISDYLFESGIYTILVCFEGDGVNDPVLVNTTFIIRYDSVLTVNDVSIIVGEDGFLIANLSDIRGQLTNKTIIFNIDGNNFTNNTDYNGISSINIGSYIVESGIYNANIYFLGDNINNPVSVDSTVILRYDSYVSVNDLSIVLGDDGILIANLSDSRGPLTNKDIIFTINGNNYTKTTDSQGVAKINVKGILTESGIYTVTINYAGDNVNNPVSNDTTVIVRYDSILKSSNLDVFITEDGILTANLSDSRGPLANKDIIFTINGNTCINTTDSSGLTSINVKNFLTVAGPYTVYLNFEGDIYDNPTSTSANVIINKYDSIITANNLSVVQGKDAILTARLSDQRGAISNKLITFNINGKKRTGTTDSQGVVSINVKDDLTDVDEYSVNISFAGDGYDKEASTNANVIIKYESILNVNDLSVKLGNDGIIIANLSTKDNQQTNKNIKFKINNVFYSNTTDSDGIAKFNVKNYLTKSGIYTILVGFDGDKFNDPVSASSNVIIRYDSTLMVDGISVYITQDAVLTAKLSDSRGALKNKNIIFTINGNSNTATTNSNGIATLNVKEYLTRAMTYTFGVSFEGDSENNPVSTNVNVVVNKYDSSINVQGISVYIGTDGILSATLSDARGSLANKVLTFTIDGRDYTNTTNSNGIAKFNVKNYLMQANTYSVIVSFAGDDYDNASSANVNIVIKKYSPTLTVNSLSIHKGEDGIINAKLSDSRGVLSNKVISFTIQGNKYTNTTNSEGISSINVKNYLTESGSYTVGVSFEGDGWDNSVSRNSNVIIRYDSVLNADNVSIALGEDGSLIASLSDVRGVLSGKRLIFTVNNIKRTINTNGYGLAALSLKELLTSSGEYLVNIAFEGDNYDNPVSANVTVIVRWDVNLDVDETYIYKGEEGNVSVVLSDVRGVLANKNVTFTINNENHTVLTDREGIALIKVTDYLSSLGSHTIGIGFAGDSYDNPLSITSNVIIRQYDTTLTVNNLSIVKDENGILIANLSNIRSPLKYKYVSFTIGMTKVTKTTDSEGIATFNVKTYFTELGDYTVRVSFEGDDYNKPVSADAHVRVNTYIGKLTITQEGKYYEDTALKIKLVDAYNDQPKNGVVKLVFSNNITYSAQTDANGIVSYNCNQFKPGIYNVSATVADLYADINVADLSFTISELVGAINVTKVDYSKTLKIRLYNPENGDMYRNVKVDLQFSGSNDLHDTAITDSDGVATYNMPFTPGIYSVIATVNGDYKQFEPGELKNIVISDKDTTKVSFSPEEIIFDYGSSGFTIVTVEGGSINIANITVIGQNANISLDANNKVIVSGLDAGKYKLRVVTTPDSAHDYVIALCNITVNKVYSSVGFDNNIAFDYLDSGSTTVNVVGGNVGNVTIDGNPEGALINLTGNKITVSGLNAGTYTLRVTSNPDENHKSVDGTAHVTVRKIDSEVNVNDVTFNYAQSGSTTVIVNGGIVEYRNIKVIGQPLANISFANNMITVSNLNVGTYTLSVTSTPDANHYASTGTAVITVNKIDSKVTLINPIEFDYGGSDFTSVYSEGCSISKENISVLDESGNKVDAKITYENNVISVSNLAAGIYKLIVISTPDANHKSVSASRNITVNKVASEIKSYTSIVFNYLATGSTYITVDGGSLSTEKMEIAGHKEARISYANNQIMVSNLDPGKYTLKVTSVPDENHYADVKFIEVTVNKAPVKIQPSSVRSFQINRGVWKIKVLDSANRPIGNLEVTLKVYTGNKFKTVTVVTDRNGEATYKIKGLSKGTHKVVLSVYHKGYASKDVTSSLKIIKPKVLKFKVKKRDNSKKGSLITFQILDKKTKRGVNGVKVKLMIYTGKKYKAFILKSKKVGKFKGIVGVFTNEFSVGKHKVVVKPISLKYSGSGKSTITIKKSAKKYSKKTTKA